MRHREVELKFAKKAKVRMCRVIEGARCKRCDGFSTGLGEHAKMLEVRVFEIESSEQRVEPYA